MVIRDYTEELKSRIVYLQVAALKYRWVPVYIASQENEKCLLF